MEYLIITIIMSVACAVAIMIAIKTTDERNKLAGEIFKLWQARGESKDDPLYPILLEYGYFN